MRIIDGPVRIKWAHKSSSQLAAGEFGVIDEAAEKVLLSTPNRTLAEAFIEARSDHGVCVSCHTREASTDFGHCRHCVEETAREMLEDAELAEAVQGSYSGHLDVDDVIVDPGYDDSADTVGANWQQFAGSF